MRPAFGTLILTTFLLSTFVYVSAKGLGFHMDRTQENPYNELVCFLDTDHTDNIIFSILDISITNVNHAGNNAKLASASLFQTEVFDDSVTTDVAMNASGSVSRYHARLRVRVGKHSGCELSSYLCEVTYMNMAGSTDKIHAVVNITLPEVIEGELSDQSGLSLLNQLKELSAAAVNLLATRSDDIEKLRNLTDRLESFFEGQSRIAFSAILTHHLSLGANKVVVYDTVYSNEGEAYNVSTGIFTAPISGSYVFHFHTLSQSSGSVAYLALYQDTLVKAHLYSEYKTQFSDAAGSVILPLKKGDTVYTKTVKASHLFGYASERYASFSGFLI